MSDINTNNTDSVKRPVESGNDTQSDTYNNFHKELTSERNNLSALPTVQTDSTNHKIPNLQIDNSSLPSKQAEKAEHNSPAPGKDSTKDKLPKVEGLDELETLIVREHLRGKSQKLAGELGQAKDFFSKEEQQALKDVVEGKKPVDKFDENKLLMNRIREHFKTSAAMGIAPEKVIEQMNEALKKSGASFSLKMENSDKEGFSLAMYDNASGKKLAKDGLYCSIRINMNK